MDSGTFEIRTIAGSSADSVSAAFSSPEWSIVPWLGEFETTDRFPFKFAEPSSNSWYPDASDPENELRLLCGAEYSPSSFFSVTFTGVAL